MTLQELLEGHTLPIKVQHTQESREQVIVIEQVNDVIYKVQGCKTDVFYTERCDAVGYSVVPNKFPG